MLKIGAGWFTNRQQKRWTCSYPFWINRDVIFTTKRMDPHWWICL